MATNSGAAKQSLGLPVARENPTPNLLKLFASPARCLGDREQDQGRVRRGTRGSESARHSTTRSQPRHAARRLCADVAATTGDFSRGSESFGSCMAPDSRSFFRALAWGHGVAWTKSGGVGVAGSQITYERGYICIWETRMTQVSSRSQEVGPESLPTLRASC